MVLLKARKTREETSQTLKCLETGQNLMEKHHPVLSPRGCGFLEGALGQNPARDGLPMAVPTELHCRGP